MKQLVRPLGENFWSCQEPMKDHMLGILDFHFIYQLKIDRSKSVIASQLVHVDLPSLVYLEDKQGGIEEDETT